jgi:hypothetical protein
MTCNVDGTETEMFGFYPQSHIAGGASYWFGPVNGQIVSDVRTQIDSYFFKKIEFVPAPYKLDSYLTIV